jgi:hypothetical protein
MQCSIAGCIHLGRNCCSCTPLRPMGLSVPMLFPALELPRLKLTNDFASTALFPQTTIP